MTPIRRVSAKKYHPPPAEPDRAAKVRFRVKGSNTEGNLYQGQQIIRRCKNCGPR